MEPFEPQKTMRSLRTEGQYVGSIPAGNELRDFFESETPWERARSEASIDSFAPAHSPCGLSSMSLDPSAPFPPGTVWVILRVIDSGLVDVARRSSSSFRRERSFVKKSGRISSEFLTNVCYSLQLAVCHYLQAAILQVDVRSPKLACLVLFLRT